LRSAAALLIIMGVYALNGVLVVLDSPISVNKLIRPVTYFFSQERFATVGLAPIVNGQQQVTILAENDRYSPSFIRVKKGIPVQLTVQTRDTYSCTVAFTFREFGIDAFLGPNDSETFNFTPDTAGRFAFSCSMGMYSGVFEVVE
jgi:plastocyanin domain-containing protein